MTAELVEAPDRTLADLSAYIRDMRYDRLPPEVIDKAKAHLVDTLGAMVGGHGSEPARLARGLCGDELPQGAAIVGSRRRVAPDLAAFANAVAARGVDTLDAYHRHGKVGHPADVAAPLVTVADHAGASGKELIVATVIAYELFCWLRDDFDHAGFDNTNCARIAAAAGAARLLGLDTAGISRCLALATALDNVLKEARSRPAAMTRNTAAGYGARGAVFAALMAAAGAAGRTRALEGPAGWLGLVAGGTYDPATLGGAGGPFRILDTWLKLRAIPGVAYPLVIAAEKLAPLADPQGVERITLDVYGKLRKGFGEGDKRWAPDSRDTADHSAPYIVATILTRGALTPRTFDADHIADPATRALMARVEVHEDPAFSRAYAERHDHCARITVHRTDGRRQVAQTGGDADDFNAPRSRVQLDAKFRMLTHGLLAPDQAARVLGGWWALEETPDIRSLVADLAFGN